MGQRREQGSHDREGTVAAEDEKVKCNECGAIQVHDSVSFGREDGARKYRTELR